MTKGLRPTRMLNEPTLNRLAFSMLLKFLAQNSASFILSLSGDLVAFGGTSYSRMDETES